MSNTILSIVLLPQRTKTLLLLRGVHRIGFSRLHELLHIAALTRWRLRNEQHYTLRKRQLSSGTG